MARLNVTVDLHVLDEPECGWCDHCLLPSVAVQHFALELEGSPLEVLRARRCVECGAEPT